MSSLLIGSTGYVGSHISKTTHFDMSLHSRNIGLALNTNHDFLLCAGLPAAKWLANSNPEADLQNVKYLSSILSTTTAKRAMLISTIDVYQPPLSVNEDNDANISGPEAYGCNRARFESFFLNHFPNSQILRLPGLFSPEIRKNLVFDLLNNRKAFYENYSPDSEYQFFNLQNLQSLMDVFLSSELTFLNVTSDPIKASVIADIFEKRLFGNNLPVKYNVLTRFGKYFGVEGEYLVSQDSIIKDLISLKESYKG